MDWVPVPVNHAKMFDLLEREGDHLVVVFASADDQDTLAVYQIGEKGSIFQGAVVIPEPVTEMVALSTTHIPYLSALGQLHHVIGASYTTHIMDSAAQVLVRNGQIAEVSRGDGPDLETLISLSPQVVTCYPFGGAGEVPLRQSNVAYVQIAEYLESDPMGRAEWLKVFGVLFGKLGMADSLFLAIEGRYEAARALIKEGDDRPQVLFGSTWQGQWHAPGGESYMAQLIEHAGAHYVLEDRKGQENLELDLEELIDRATTADFLGKVLDAPNEVTSEMLTADARARDVVNDEGIVLFYANSRESDIFGKAVVEPDAVLRDLIHIFHQRQLPDHHPKYYQRLGY